MIAGRMRDKVRLYRPSEELNAFGEAVQTWVLSGECRAERARRSGMRHEEVGEHFADVRVTWLVRDVHAVQPNWRLVDARTDEMFVIVAVTPNRERGYNELTCERYNE